MKIERELLEKLKPFLKKKKGYALTIKKRLQDKGFDYSPQSIYVCYSPGLGLLAKLEKSA